MQIRPGFTKKDYDKKGFLKKAVMLESQAIDYVCPNNRNGDNKKGGHFYALHTGESLPKKKIPKCPYCKTLCETVNWEQKTKKETDDDRQQD